MKEPEVTPELAQHHGLPEEEFSLISDTLGRNPSYTELRILAFYWSEACSRKSSKSVLDSLPLFREDEAKTRQGKPSHFVDSGGDTVISLKSHTCNLLPRANPKEVALTCAAGVLREVATSGVSPGVVFYSRVVGSLEKRGIPRTVRGLMRGAEECGKALNVRAIPAQLVFDEGYNENALFTAIALGTGSDQSLVFPKATGEGNPVFLLGRKETEMDDGLSVDIALERSLLEVTAELSRRNYLVGMNSVGVGGIGGACIDMAVQGQSGITLYLGRLPFLEKGAVPSHMLLSEIHGRIVVVISNGFEKELRTVCRKSGVDCMEIGVVNGKNEFSVRRGKKVYCSIPLTVFMRRTETPVYRLKVRKPDHLAGARNLGVSPQKKRKSWNSVMLALLESPNVVADRIGGLISDRYELDDNLLRMIGSERKVVLRLCGSGRYMHMDPEMGGKYAMAGAARKTVSRGAHPSAAVSSFTCGNLLDPETFYVFKEAVAGMAHACREFQIPVVDKTIDCQPRISFPSLLAGVLGFMEQSEQLIVPTFHTPDDFILLLGSHRGELGGSEFLKTIHKRLDGPLPIVDVGMERRIYEIILMINKIGLIKSAKDVSIGGLAVAVAHCLVGSDNGLGARIHMSSKIREDELLFGETQGLFIITIDEDSLIEIERICMRMGVPCTAIGRVTGDGTFAFNESISLKVEKMKKLFSESARKIPMGRWQR